MKDSDFHLKITHLNAKAAAGQTFLWDLSHFLPPQTVYDHKREFLGVPWSSNTSPSRIQSSQTGILLPNLFLFQACSALLCHWSQRLWLYVLWRTQGLESRDLSSNINFAVYSPASFEVNNGPFPGKTEGLGKATMPEAPVLPPLG